MCNATSDNFQLNGGCFGNTTCGSPFDGAPTICLPSLAAGEACVSVGGRLDPVELELGLQGQMDIKSGWADQCGPGLYCPDVPDSVCVARSALGRPCTSDRGCGIDLHCRELDNVCAAYFASGVGSSCENILDCLPGLFCSKAGQCAETPMSGQSCNTTLAGNTCVEGLYCACSNYPADDTTPYSQVCLPVCTLTQSDVQGAQDLLNCARDADCQGTLSPTPTEAKVLNYYPGSCLQRACADKYEAGHKDLNKCLNPSSTNFYLQNPCRFAALRSDSRQNTWTASICLFFAILLAVLL